MGSYDYNANPFPGTPQYGYWSGGEYFGLPRQSYEPVVQKVVAGYVYTLADTAQDGTSDSIRGNIARDFQTYDTIIPDASIFYTMSLDVHLHLPFYGSVARANAETIVADDWNSQGNRPITTEYDIAGMFTNDVTLQGYSSAAELSNVLANKAVRNKLPYIGNLAQARVPSGMKSQYFPYDHVGMYKFQWPNGSEAIISANAATRYKPAADFIPGWIPGYSVKAISVSFSPKDFRFDTNYVVTLSSEYLYRMTGDPVTINGSDVWGITQ